MRRLETDVCIVGAGPAGAILSLLLARKGYRVMLLERSSNFNREYRGEILQPTTIHLIDQLGLLNELMQQPHKLIKQGGVYHKQKRIMNFTMKELSDEYPYSLQMNQAALIEWLLEQAKRYDNFTIHMNFAVNELSMGNAGEILGVRGQWNSEETEVCAKITVGSDGRHSTMRKLSNFRTTREHHRSNLIWFTLDWPAHLPHELMYFLMGKNNLFMIPKYPDKMQIGYTFSKEELSRVKMNHYQEIRDVVNYIFPELKEQMDRNKTFVKLDVISTTLEQWATDRFALIGDAAHVMTPIGVIGINAAVADAVVAASVIEKAFQKNEYSKEMLSAIEKERRPQTDYIQDLQLKVESMIFTTNRLMAAIRPYVIRFISKTPIKTRIMKKFFFPADKAN